MVNLFDLTGQVALVTGATGHLGKAMCEGLASHGAKVIIQGRDANKVNALCESLTIKGFLVVPAVFDITDHEQCIDYFNACSEEKINVLVNNAYAGNGGTTTTSTDSEFNDSYNITVTAAHRMFNLCLSRLRAAVKLDDNASIINMASMYGVVSPEQPMYPCPTSTNPPFYGAAKAALIQWTKYLASEFAMENIRVNSISPGPFPSVQAQQDNTLMKAIQNKVPLGRLGQPSELVGSLVFLASNASSYITGINLKVDGGWTIR